jgi:hypothetical protein
MRRDDIRRSARRRDAQLRPSVRGGVSDARARIEASREIEAEIHASQRVRVRIVIDRCSSDAGVAFDVADVPGIRMLQAFPVNARLT